MWNFIVKGEQEAHDPAECTGVGPFLTSLFDGEATPEEAQRARAHLVACQDCADLWLQWNRTRSVLQEAPVPAPPPNMLWRVLLACRLSGFGVGRKSASTRSHAGKPQRQRQPQPQAPVGGLVLAPDDLKARVLAMTVGQSVPVPRPRAMAAFQWMRMPAAALPALALLLMTTQWDSVPFPTPGQGAAAVSALGVQGEVSAQAVEDARPRRAENGVAGSLARTGAPHVGTLVGKEANAVNAPVPQFAAAEAETAAQQSVARAFGPRKTEMPESVRATLVVAEASPSRPLARTGARTAVGAAVGTPGVVRSSSTEGGVFPQSAAPLRLARMTVDQDEIAPSPVGFRPMKAVLAPRHWVNRAALRVAEPMSHTAAAVAPLASPVRATPIRLAWNPREIVETEEGDASFAEVRTAVNDYRALFAEVSVEEGG